MDKQISLDYLNRLLSYSGSKEPMTLAGALCDEFGDVHKIMQTEAYVLLRSSVPDSAVQLIRLTAALTSRRITDRYKLNKKYTDAELKEYICALFVGVCVETVYVLLFDDGGKLVGCEYMGEGTVNSSEVLPRRICDISVRRGSRNVIVAHNHPRGNANPSAADISATSALCKVLRGAGINLIANYAVCGFEASDCMSCLQSFTSDK